MSVSVSVRPPISTPDLLALLEDGAHTVGELAAWLHESVLHVEVTLCHLEAAGRVERTGRRTKRLDGQAWMLTETKAPNGGTIPPIADTKPVKSETKAPIPDTPTQAPTRAARSCDHKFIDSKACLKCGWTPESPAPRRTPSRQAPKPSEPAWWVKYAAPTDTDRAGFETELQQRQLRRTKGAP